MIQEIVMKMIHYFEQDVTRLNHALKVWGFAQTIAKREKIVGEELFVIQVAAILHDIGIKESERKYQSSSGKYQEIEGPPIARDILGAYDLEPSIVERICYLIGHHHTYGMINGIDYQILIEADFLVNIFEDHIKKEQVFQIREKYFRTKAGIELIESMYC